MTTRDGRPSTPPEGDSASAERARAVLGVLEARLAETAEAVVARARATVAEGAWPEAALAAGDVRTPVEALTRVLIAAAEADDADLSVANAVLSTVGSRAVAQGLDLAATRALLRATVEEVHERVCAVTTEVARATTPPDDAGDRLQHVGQAALRLLGECLTAAHDAHVAVESDGEGRAAGFLRQVLEGTVDAAEVEAQAGRMGLADFAPPFVLLAVTAGVESPSALEHACVEVARRAPLRLLRPVLVEGEGGGFAVLVGPGERVFPSRRQELDEAARGVGVTLVVERAAATAALPEAFDNLRRVVTVARAVRSAHGTAFDQRVFTIDELLPHQAACSMDASLQARLLRERLGPLMTPPAHRAALNLAILQVKCALGPDVTQREVGARVGLSRSAAAKRIDKIEEVTGLSFGRDFVLLSLVSHLYDLLEEHLPPAGDPWWSDPAL